MGYHQRRLPHWEVIGQTLFVTFHLHGSLPPVRAGLVALAEEFAWSSAAPGRSPAAG
jgi:hypothetical protein